MSGVDEAACSTLQVANLRHRSALLEIGRRDHLPSNLVGKVFERIAANWADCRAQAASRRSTQNWRWREPKLPIGDENSSAEVRLERALMAAAEAQGRSDWANQVPVASGVAGGATGRRRAVDLVHRRELGWFELIELKVASDTPLYAALEITAYACLWLMARNERDGTSEILTAQRIDARVLAPQAYYARYALNELERVTDAGLSEVGAQHGVQMSFAFQSFADSWAAPPLVASYMSAILDRRARVTPCG